MEEKRKYDCCQNCGIDADCEIVDQKTGLCQECTTGGELNGTLGKKI